MCRKLFLFFLLISSYSFAQKKPLNHQVYDAWESIGSKQVSKNGQWLSYLIQPQEGDAKVYFQHTSNGQKVSIPRGAAPQYSADSKFAALSIKAFYKDLRQARIKKKKPEEMPKDSLAIVNLSSLQVVKIPAVKSFRLPDQGAPLIAYLLAKEVDTTKKTAGNTTDKEGTKLILKNLQTGTERTFNYVTDYLFSKDGNALVYVSSGSKKDSTAVKGVFLYTLEKQQLKTLVKGNGTFKGFVFDEEGEKLAFLGETGPEKQEIKDFRVYYHSKSLDTAQILIDSETPGLPDKFSISGDGRISFNKGGTRLFFGIAPVKLPKDTSLIDFEHAKLDIWGYRDAELQTMQLRNAERESKRSYLATIDIYSSDYKMIPLADLQLPDATLIDEGNADFVLSSSDLRNRMAIQWAGNAPRDYYLVNTKTGIRKKILENLNGNAFASPAGQYILYFNRSNGQWYTHQISSGKVTALTEGMQVSFVNEENDVPDLPNSYSIAGWAEDDKTVFIYDRYDIWAFSPDGKTAPKNLTNGLGRANRISFRVERTDPEKRYFDRKETVLLTGFNQVNKETGIYRTQLNDQKAPELLTASKARFSSLLKAKNADIYVFDKGNFQQSPDVYYTKDFKTETKVSSTNPQQKEYNWGTAELIKWTTPKGHFSEGILYKPEDFDPAKKYPMIVYFYEKLSDGLYGYQAPAPTPSRLNISYFVSNGYLVFAPDISYEIGYPGKSAEEFINSGVEYLKKNAWVDGTKIGIQGQSWGGYQVAHLITATNMYAAAWSGAPVVNMTSAYGGIRWESGMNRQFQYEKTQSRIGATLWEKPELYIENSPLFHFPKVTTPVVIMANDADGAVPWYQGIEMFTGLKRLGKPAWLLNYNNEAHNLVQRQNRKDIQIRQQQFFDHYLKGAKAPVWMVQGVPATEKGRSWGFELTDEQP